MRLFLSPDGTSGFALDGDHIHSVFNHAQGPHHNASNAMLDLAVAQGGRRLIAHGDVLPAVFSRNRFQATAKHPMPDGSGGEMTHMVYSPGKHDFYNSREAMPVKDFAAADKLQQRASVTSLGRIRKTATDDENRKKAADKAARAAEKALANPPPVKKKAKKASGGSIGASGPTIDRAMAAARRYREARP
jgi:hypothetical protein